MEKNLLFLGHRLNLIAIIILITLNLMLFMLFDNEFRHLLLYIIIILLLIPIMAVLSTKFNYFGLKYTTSKKNNHRKVSPYLGVISTLSGAAGIGFARVFLSNISDNSATVIVCIIFGALILTFIFFGCVQYHQVYLIRKYCPHLKDRVGY